MHDASYHSFPQLTPNGLYSLIEDKQKNVTVQILSADVITEGRAGGQGTLKYK